MCGYKGQAPNLISNNGCLTAVLQIHSVEARHAAHLHEMRKAANLLVPAGVDVKPWITLNQSGIGTTAVQASYNGEENVTQAGIAITNIGGKTFLPQLLLKRSMNLLPKTRLPLSQPRSLHELVFHFNLKNLGTCGDLFTYDEI